MPLTVNQQRDAVRRARRIVRETKKKLATQPKLVRRRFIEFRRILLSEVAKTEFDIAHLASLRRSVDEVIAALDSALKGDLREALRTFSDLGEKLVIEPMVGLLPAGAGLSVTGVSAQTLLIANVFSGDLIQAISSTLRKDINQLVVRGVTGLNTPAQSIRDIDARLAKAGALTYERRAEQIFETESMRLLSMSQDVTADRVDEIVDEEMYRVWRWSGKSRVNHAAIDGQVRRNGETFDVPPPLQVSAAPNPTDYRGGERARYPRDPSLSAGNAIRCGCLFLLVEKAEAMRIAASQGSQMTFPPDEEGLA